MIESFQVMNQTANAFELTEHVCRVSGLIRELKNDGTPEGITRMENVEELILDNFHNQTIKKRRFFFSR
jgi:DNA helicase-2/ATP-dependent DNA helicase PcrA